MKKSIHNNIINQYGVTLVELLIYMGLFAGFLILLSGLFISILDVQQESVETARLEQDAQFLFSRLQHDIYQADEILQPTVEGERSDVLVLLINEQEQIYMLENSKLFLSSNLSEPEPITNPEVIVSELSFHRLGNEDGFPSIRTTLTLESIIQNRSNPEKRELFFTFGTR